jgi:hypothetical protein
VGQVDGDHHSKSLRSFYTNDPGSNFGSSSFWVSEAPPFSIPNGPSKLSPRRPGSVIDISDGEGPPSPQSDTPSQLLDEVRKIANPRKLLNDARELALRLPPSIPEARPGDFLFVWDANNVDSIVLAMPDGGADPSEDCEYIDRTLNHVFQSVPVSYLVKEMRRGPCGALGIIEGLAFFAETRGLNLEQFEIKILKLKKALARLVGYVLLSFSVIILESVASN